MANTPPRATLADVALAASVAKSTASLAFSAPGRVAPATVTRVQEAASRLGYSPNPIAQSLKSQHGSMIGLLISDMNNPLNALTLTEAQHAAHEVNRLLLTSTSEGNPAKEIAILEQFARLKIKGVILTSSGQGADHAARLNRIGLQLVTLDLKLPHLRAHHVGLDNVKATSLLTRHLIAHGHRRIAYLSGDPGMSTAESRLDGFRKTMAEAALEIPDTFIAHADFAGTKALSCADTLLALPNPPTALIAANNIICARAIQAVRARGLHCPRDVSIVAVDPLPWAEIIDPQITCVEQPFAEMAKLATDWIAAAHRYGTAPDEAFKTAELAPVFMPGASVSTVS